MVQHEVTFINSEPKNNITQGDKRIIRADLIKRNKIKITLLHEIPVPKAMIYDSFADFALDWMLDRTYHAREEEW
jgi:hypothetical protein